MGTGKETGKSMARVCQTTLWFRTKRIGAYPEKSDLVNFRGPD